MTRKVHAAGVIFENEHGEVLVLKRQDGNPESGTWGLTGGKVGLQENSKSAVIRKVKAEIGYAIDPDDLRFIRTYYWDRADIAITFEVFQATSLSSVDRLSIDPKGHSESAWIHPAYLYARDDLMQGLYPILSDTYHLDKR